MGVFVLHKLIELFTRSPDICIPIHGPISLHPLCVAIIDTPQFQRLRNIMQLGPTSLVFPGGTHSRFEHSLGVAHLARLFVETLKKHQPELEVTQEEMLCMEVAGLCHDLGHGPLSHLWEEAVNAKASAQGQQHWSHEEASCKMLDYLIEHNDLKKEFEREHIAERINFIKALILGKPIKDLKEETEKKKYFLYEIVNNTESGLDVDKWDYFLRDALHLGLPANFCYKRIMEHARVMDYQGINRICFRDKTAYNIYGMFHTRSMLHKAVYQHRVVKTISCMVLDAIKLANGNITGPEGGMHNFFEVTREYDMERFSKFNDSLVLSGIVDSKDNNISAVKAREILDDVLHRRLYTCIIDEIIDVSERIDVKDLRQLETDILDEVCSVEQGEPVVSREDVSVHFSNIHWGKNHENPVACVLFFSKKDVGKPFYLSQEEVKVTLPMKFQEVRIHVYCKHKDARIHDAIERRAKQVIRPSLSH